MHKINTVMKGVQSILHSQLLISLAIFFGAIIDNGFVYEK
jgi:hypothetical protein